MERIRLENTVKEVVEKHPVTRRIFETYGIMCGSNVLPNKPLSFFAKMHNINPSQLIDDLQKLINGEVDSSTEVAITKPETEHVYEIFVKTAIIIVLSTGCLYGASLLAYSAFRNSLSSVTWILTETHGDTQVYGWVGLFLIGKREIRSLRRVSLVQLSLVYPSGNSFCRLILPFYRCRKHKHP